MIASMSKKGDCWHNAPTERFSRSLKSDHLTYCKLSSREMAKKEVLAYITFYDADRLHSSLDYVSPMDYEKQQSAWAA